MKNVIALIFVTFIIYGCATTSSEELLIEQGGHKMTPDEITQTFRDVKEQYIDSDNPALTAESEWHSDGAFKATWKSGEETGNTSGKWYVENEMRCIKHDVPLPNGLHTECHRMYQTGDTYTSINPDGSIHGEHSNSPL